MSQFILEAVYEIMLPYSNNLFVTLQLFGFASKTCQTRLYLITVKDFTLQLGNECTGAEQLKL